MLNRIRETVRILTYRDKRPAADIPDMEVRPESPDSATPAGKRIARIIESLTLVLVAGIGGERIAYFFTHLLDNQKQHTALPTLAGVVAALLVIVVNWLVRDLHTVLHMRLNLRTHLAPYFGHRLDNAIRILRS